MIWSLTAIAIVAGIALRWIFHRFSPRDRIDQAKRQIRAQLYALRLFAADPALVFRAQKRLLIWNARYLALMLPATAIAIVPGIALFMQLDKVYGTRPLAPGESAIVTAGFNADVPADSQIAGPNVMVETPAVRLPTRHEVCWRVRGTGRLQLQISGIPAQWIKVAYPAARLGVFGYGIAWPIWFFAVSLVAMLAAARV